MKKTILLLFLLAFVYAMPAAAEGESIQVLSEAERIYETSEADLARLSERVCELGYSNAPSLSLRYSEILSLLSSELYDVPISPSSLFSYDAPYSLLTWKKDSFFIGAMPHETITIDSASASEILTVGTVYTITDEETGVQIRMKYAGPEGDASVFSAGSKWDAATLSGVFEGFFDYRTRQCSLQIGDNAYKAYCQIPPSFLLEEDPAGCLLYWSRPAGLADLLKASSDE